jgi:hypothetical protein
MGAMHAPQECQVRRTASWNADTLQVGVEVHGAEILLCFDPEDPDQHRENG